MKNRITLHWDYSDIETMICIIESDIEMSEFAAPNFRCIDEMQHNADRAALLFDLQDRLKQFGSQVTS